MYSIGLMLCIVFSQNTAQADNPAHDSIVDYIISGRFEEASAYASGNFLRFKNDDLVLGFVYFAERNFLLLETPVAIGFMLQYREKEINKEWERFSKAYPDNVYIMQILSVLYISEKPKKAKSIASLIAKQDPESYMPYLIRGHLYMNGRDFIRAASEYLNAYNCDSSVMLNILSLAYADIRYGDYDNALKYFLKPLLSDTVYNVYLLWAVLTYLKTDRYVQAESLLSVLAQANLITVGDNAVDTLKTFFKKYNDKSISESDSFIVRVGGMYVLLTADSVEIHERSKVYKQPYIETIRPMSKDDYRMQICGKGISKQPYFGLFINKKGVLEDIFVFISSGNLEVDDACMEHLRQQKYKPATVFGRPIDTGAILPSQLYFK